MAQLASYVSCCACSGSSSLHDQVRDLRHTFATLIASDPETSERELQAWLGHADLRTMDPSTAIHDAEVVAIDVPIGFGPRAADGEARKFLTGASSTVFSTPSREVLERPYGPGLGISAQAHALGPRILNVTTLAQTDGRIREVHPEVLFRAMNDG